MSRKRPKLVIPEEPGQDKKREEADKEEADLSDLIGPSEEASDIKIPQQVSIPLARYKYTIISAGLIVIALGIIIFYVLPNATVMVTARTEAISRDLEVLVDNNVAVPDIQNLQVPGQTIVIDLDYSGTFPATGAKRVGEKASGFVTLNNFSNNNLILRRDTTRLEVDGKSFFFLQDVSRLTPTQTDEAGQVVQSSLIDPVPIAAQDPGSDFNIPAGTRFEIINEVFGHQPEILFATNNSPVSGGSDKEVTILAEKDIFAARASSTVELLDRLSAQLSESLGSEVKITLTSAQIEVLEESFSHELGAETAEFTMIQKVRIRALVYELSDVKEIMIERIVRLLPDNKTLLPSDDEISAEFISLDLAAGAGTLRAHINSSIIYEINSDFLKRSLHGKTAVEAKEILLARPEINDVEIVLSPFWIKKIPRFEGKLDFKVVE